MADRASVAARARSRVPLRRAKLPASRTTRCVPALRVLKSIVRKGNKANPACLLDKLPVQGVDFLLGSTPFFVGASWWGRGSLNFLEGLRVR